MASFLLKIRGNENENMLPKKAIDQFKELYKKRYNIELDDKEVLLRWRDEKLNFEKLDAFLKLLSRHKSTKRIWGYISADLNVVFGKHAENLDIFSSDKEFKEYLKYQVYQFDAMGNMDW